jgi:lipid A ethanolaminephosphotransferase
VLAPSWQQRDKPVLFVMVVGESVRAANWGLNDHSPHPTTPELAQRDVINFVDVDSCGTNTEVSVPCLFSMQGRRNYDEDAIRGSESLLHVLQRAGLQVVWRDNQSGCKGVCEGLEVQRPDPQASPSLCDGDRCLDEALLQGAEGLLRDTHGNLVLVLHQLGNHGPAYYKRYPAEFRRFTPTCDTDDLSRCSREEIANSYDNAVLYTDHALARTIDMLKSQQAHYDTALLYVSDHGESLGEKGLFLHGMPYAIAPSEQTKVPMAMWFSPGYAKSFGLDLACLRLRARQPASHDNVFHSILGLLDVRTGVLDPSMDLSATCRS